MTPQTVNAYYNPAQERDRLPRRDPAAAVLRPNADDAVNYGAIGAVIGHEIGHGFDDQGRQFDGDGKLRDWWTPADDAEFRKRATDARRAVQRVQARSPGLHVNGELTLGENIGDLGGLVDRVQGVQGVARTASRRRSIDGFTGEQRFFLGLGAGRGARRCATNSCAAR